MTVDAAPPVADIGHVHLKVAELDAATAFYRDVLGMTVRNAVPGAVFLAFGDYHHHVALNTWQSANGAAPEPGCVGLYHFAIRFASRRDLALAVTRLQAAGHPIDSSSDCGGIADSIYLRDPDGNGVELTWDRPAELRPHPLRVADSSLDLEELLAELRRS